MSPPYKALFSPTLLSGHMMPLSHIGHTPHGVASNEDRQRRARGSAPRALFHCVSELPPRVPEETCQRTTTPRPLSGPPLYRLVKAERLRRGPAAQP